jgi:hypothetical protein
VIGGAMQLVKLRIEVILQNFSDVCRLASLLVGNGATLYATA